MWRRTLLVRKGFLSNHKVSPTPHALDQVLVPLGSSNLISVQLVVVASSRSSSHFTTWVSKKPIFSSNLRRFSTHETPANAPPGSDIKLDMAEEFDQDVSALDQKLKTLLGKEEDDEVDEEKLENVVSLLRSSGGGVDGSLIASLEGMGELVLSNKFLVRVLQRFLPKENEKIPIENLIAFFSWCLAKLVYVGLHTLHALAMALCIELKKNNAYAEKESGLLNTETLNKLLYLFYYLARGEDALEVFNKIEEFGVADADTYYYTIQALLSEWEYELAYSVCQRMVIAGKLPNAEKLGYIIFAFSRKRKLRAAYSVYMLLKAKNCSPTMDSVNFLIAHLCYLPRKDEDVNSLIVHLLYRTRKDKDNKDKDNKKYHENIYLALSVLEGFSGEYIKSMLEGYWKKAMANSFYRVIRALCQVGDVEKAKEVLVKMTDAGMPTGEGLMNMIKRIS